MWFEQKVDGGIIKWSSGRLEAEQELENQNFPLGCVKCERLINGSEIHLSGHVRGAGGAKSLEVRGQPLGLETPCNLGVINM